MTKIDFNPESYSHRHLLALAIRDFINTPGHALSSTNVPASHSLRHACATSKSQLDRLSRAPNPDDPKTPYARNARQVARFLEKRGFFPPGQDIDKTLKILPVFFDGFSSSAPTVLDHLTGEYASYQFSNLNPDAVLVGTLVIEPRTAWNYARVQETIQINNTGLNTLIYEGVAFTDEEKNLYILTRERNHRHPRFYLFDDCHRPAGTAIETLYGTLLGGARQRKRQLSPIALHRGADPRPSQPVKKPDLSALPKYVRSYLARELKAGAQNAEADPA